MASSDDELISMLRQLTKTIPNNIPRDIKKESNVEEFGEPLLERVKNENKKDKVSAAKPIPKPIELIYTPNEVNISLCADKIFVDSNLMMQIIPASHIKNIQVDGYGNVEIEGSHLSIGEDYEETVNYMIACSRIDQFGGIDIDHDGATKVVKDLSTALKKYHLNLASITKVLPAPAVKTVVKD